MSFEFSICNVSLLHTSCSKVARHQRINFKILTASGLTRKSSACLPTSRHDPRFATALPYLQKQYLQTIYYIRDVETDCFKHRSFIKIACNSQMGHLRKAASRYASFIDTIHPNCTLYLHRRSSHINQGKAIIM